MRQKRLIAAICVVLLVVGGAALFVMGPPTPVPPAAPVPPTAQPAATPNPATAPSTSPNAAGTTPQTATAPDGSAAARLRLQQRLDALALAYEQGNWSAAERAMWPNHAVVRPDGTQLDRADLKEVWLEEWEAFRNRDLRFYVEKLDAKGNVAAARWTILLTADVADQDGNMRHMMVNGVQAATLVGDGDEQKLDGAIVYTSFERTLDGFAWPAE